MINVHKYRGRCFTNDRYVEGQLIVSPDPCYKEKYYILEDVKAAYYTEIQGVLFGKFQRVDPTTIEEVQQ